MMPRRNRKSGARQQSKRLRNAGRPHAAAKALGSPLYRQRVVPGKRRISKEQRAMELFWDYLSPDGD